VSSNLRLPEGTCRCGICNKNGIIDFGEHVKTPEHQRRLKVFNDIIHQQKENHKDQEFTFETENNPKENK